jgi:hypothetical protein
MLFSLYPLISRNYFILCFIVCLGALQWSAARNQRRELSLLGPWGLGLAGSVTGALLVIGGFAWFFAYTPGLFQSGLAGGELFPLFSAGGLSALLAARLAGALWQRSYHQLSIDHE